MRVLFAVLLTIFPAMGQEFSVALLTHQPLTNENVVTLAKAGFDELFILQLIRTSRTNFDISIPGLVALKQSGVSEELIHLMAMPQSTPQPAAPAAAAAVPKPAPKKHSLLPWKHTPNSPSA
jgi:hypothetical protein